MIAFLRYLLIIGVVGFGILNPTVRIAEGEIGWLIGGVAFSLYFALNRAADGVQNTTRNVARIFLNRTVGPAHQQREADFLQSAITPISDRTIGILFIFFSPVLVALMVFTIDGWPTLALVSLVTILGPFFVAPYRRSLRGIDAHLTKNAFQLVEFIELGYDYAKLHGVVSELIQSGRDPQRVWAEELEFEITKRI